MPTVDITIVREGFPAPWADLEGRDVVAYPDDEQWHVALLEGGMESGQPSIALRFDHVAEGVDALVVQTSLAALIGVLAAARGAYPEAFEGGPFQEPRA